MSRKLTRRTGHAVRGTRTLCGKTATGPTNDRITCHTCQLILNGK